MEILFIKNSKKNILKSVINNNARFYKNGDGFGSSEFLSSPERLSAIESLKKRRESDCEEEVGENLKIKTEITEDLIETIESTISAKLDKLESESNSLILEMSEIQDCLVDCLNEKEKNDLLNQFNAKKNRLNEIRLELNDISSDYSKQKKQDIENTENNGLDGGANKKTKWHDLSFGLFNSKSEANIVLKEIQNEDFLKLSDEDKISRIQDILLDFIADNKNNIDTNKFTSEEKIREIAISMLESKKIIKDELIEQEGDNDSAIKNNAEIKEENSPINISQEEIDALNKAIVEDSKLDSLEDDVKEYFTAKNKIKYLEQNSFEIGKSIISTTDSVFGNIAKGLFYNTTKKIGYDVITDKQKIRAHAEDLKYDLLQKMFPKYKDLSQTELENLLAKYNGGDKKIDKIKLQYENISKKLEEYIKLIEEKEQAENIVNEFEKDEFNVRRAKEQESILKSINNNELLEEINEKNVDIVLSILEKKRFDKEKLERLWKNYGTIAKTISVASFAVLASALALPAVAIGGAAAMTFVGAYIGGKTAWKNIREGNGLLNIVHGEKISKNGNRLAFDNEEFREKENIEELKDLLEERIKKTKDINNESRLAGVITGSLAVSAGMIIKNIIGSINNNSSDTIDINQNNASNNIHDNWENYKVASVVENKNNVDLFTPNNHPESFVELNNSKNDIDEFYLAISKHYNGNEVAHALIGGSKEKGLLRDNLSDYIYTNSDGKKFIDLQKIDQYIIDNNEKTAALVKNAKAHPEWFNNTDEIVDKTNPNKIVDVGVESNSAETGVSLTAKLVEEPITGKTAISDYFATLELPDNRKTELLNDLNNILNTSKSYEEAQFRFMEFFDRNSSSDINLDALNSEQLANFSQLKKVFTEVQLSKGNLNIKDGISDSRLTNFYDTFGRENLIKAYRNKQSFEDFYKERFPKASMDDPSDIYSYNQYFEQYKRITGINTNKNVSVGQEDVIATTTDNGMINKTIVEQTESGTKTTKIETGNISGNDLEEYNKTHGILTNAERARKKMLGSEYDSMDEANDLDSPEATLKNGSTEKVAEAFSQNKIINAYNKEAFDQFNTTFSRKETWESIKLEDVAKLGTNINNDVLDNSPFFSKMPQLISDIAKKSGFKLDNVMVRDIGYTKDGNGILINFFANNKTIPNIIILPLDNPKDGFVQSLISGVQKTKTF